MRSRLAPVVLLALVAGCSTPARPPSPERPTAPPLRVGCAPDSPPVAFRRSGEIVGIEPDFASALATELGRPLQLVQYDWVDLIPALLSGRVDVIMSGMTVTPARSVRIAFADPWLDSGLMAAMRREDASRYKTVESIMNTRATVGVREGTTGEKWVREELRDATVQLYPTSQAAVQELRERRIDLFINDAALVLWLVSANESGIAALRTRLNHDQFAWAFRQQDTALRTAANAALARWRQDGTYETIIHRWLPYWSSIK